MLELIDDFCWDKHSKRITTDRHQIPGLKNFAHWNINKSTIPMPLHIHSDIMEFHCMVKGKRFCEVNGEKFPISGNELLVTFPGEVHSTSTDAQTPNEFYAFQLDISNRERFLGMDAEFSRTLCEMLLGLKNRHLRVSPTEIKLLKQAFSLFSTLDKPSLYRGVQYICCFLFTIPTLSPAEAPTESDPLMQKVLDYIEENCCENIPLNQLAEIACLSLSRFKYKFKNFVGHTPAEYITLRKVEYAKKMLAGTDQNVTDIAFSLGFSSSNYFCSVFKRVANCSPSEYRRAVQRHAASP